MKRIKIMLASVAVLAVVGGALAFKAKSPQTLYESVGNTCPAINGWQTTKIDGVATKALYTTNEGHPELTCNTPSITAYQNAF